MLNFQILISLSTFATLALAAANNTVCSDGQIGLGLMTASIAAFILFIHFNEYKILLFK